MDANKQKGPFNFMSRTKGTIQLYVKNKRDHSTLCQEQKGPFNFMSRHKLK